MIKNIRRGGKTPEKIYRIVNGKPQEIRRAYRIVNGQSVIVWDLSSDEYLEVYSGEINRKYLERNSNQYIYPNVYWCHYVGSVLQKTYLSSYQLKSFECDTLAPQTSSTTVDGQSVEYTSCYVIDNSAGFGQHDFKITYKSPDTGNILSAEFPVYYLQEVSFDIGDTIVWYPFRNFLHSENLGYGRLSFECTANNGEKITETYNQSRNCSNVCYDFPVVDNADFRIGENQTVGYTYVSNYTLKEYTGDCIWHIRRFDDSRNTGNIWGFPIRSLETLNLKVKSHAEYYSSIVKPSSYENTEDYYAQILQNSVQESTNGTFEAPCIALDFSDHNVNVAYDIYSYPASTGYVYWGDGTLSYYAAGYQIYTSTSSASPTNTADFRVLNGYRLVNGRKTAQYIQPYINCNTHIYTANGVYSVTITSAMASALTLNSGSYNNYSPLEFRHNNSGYTKYNGDYPFVSGGEVTSYTPLKDFVLPSSPASVQIQEISIGDGCFVGKYHYVSGNYWYNRTGHYGAYNSDTADGILAPFADSDGTRGFMSMTALHLPKMSAKGTAKTIAAAACKFFMDAKSLKDIYYSGTISDFEEIFGVNGSEIGVYPMKFFSGVGNNSTFRNGEYGVTYILMVHCTDGDITVTVS